VAIRSLDYGIDVTYDPSSLVTAGSQLKLVEAIVRRFEATGLDIFMHSDAPPGSGLGSSSTMIVALCSALARFNGHEFSRYELAELAYEIEREDLLITGGMQDQYAAAFGGFNFIEFGGPSKVIVNPLRISDEIQNELHYHLMLCYTGATRASSHIVAEQTQRVVDKDAGALNALHRMRELTDDLKRSLLRGEFVEFGAILHEAWLCKRDLAPAISNSEIDALYDAARSAGAWGGKILGAGGGGYLLIAAPFRKRTDIAHALESLGGEMTDFQFDGAGVRTWTAKEDTASVESR
jgi:D-glycero-alpha-D-manno-heptose-7-phosphate kinase